MSETFKIKLKNHGRFHTIFSSPHSGCNYLKTFLENSILDVDELRSSEDAFVGELFEIAANYDSAFIEALLPRCFIDLNRSHLELDPKLIKGNFKFESSARTFAGLGVIPRLSGRGNSIYEGMLSFCEAQKRLKQFYFPYHEGLSNLILRAKFSFGYAVLFDCHSMPSSFRAIEGSGYKSNSTDIVLGDLNGISCNPHLTEMTGKIFENHGFSVKINRPFAGGFITKNYGNPRQGIHALQIEINRGLYMHEEKIERNGNFTIFKETFADIIKELSSLPIFEEFSEVAAE